MRILNSMNGSITTSYLLKGLIIMTSLFPINNSADTTQNATVEKPTLEFLEFLAEWETDLDEWVGPEQFEDNSFDQLYDSSNEITTEIETDE